MAANGNVSFNDSCLLLFYQCKISITAPNTSIYDTPCGKDFLKQCHDSTSPQESPADVELPVSLIIIFIVIAVFSFLSNVFVCFVYVLSREIRTAKHYFIVNLAVADSLIAALAIPFFLTQYINGAPKALCQVGSVIDVLCCTMSIIGFTVISLERFVAVRYPLRYPSFISRKRCLGVVAFVWFYSIAFSLLAYVPVGTLHSDHCVFFTGSYLVTIIFSSFLLPLFAMLIIYGWIYKVAKYQARQMNYTIPSGPNTSVKREFKAAKTLTLIIGVFVVCWLPFIAYIFLVVVLDISISSLPLFYAVQIVRYLNSLANPFLYVGINREFRRSALRILKRWTPSRQSGSDIESYSQATTVTVLRRMSRGHVLSETNGVATDSTLA